MNTTRLFYIFLFLMFVSSIDSTAQGGFKNFYPLYLGNGFTSSLIIDDTLFVQGRAADKDLYLFGQLLKMDLQGNIIKLDTITSKYFNNFGYAGKSTRNLLFDSSDNSILSVVYNNYNGEFIVTKSNRNLDKVWTSFFNENGEIPSLLIFGIENTIDGYLIYGAAQISDYIIKGYILKLNKYGQEVYNKLYNLGGTEVEFYGCKAISDSTFVTYGEVIGRNGWLPMRFQVYNSDNGKLVSYISDGSALNMYNLFKVDNGNERYVGISSYINQDTTNRFAHAVWYDKNFKFLRRTAFGLRDPEGWKQESYEWPYQSAMDADGNIYATTKGWLPKYREFIFYPQVDYQTEVLTLTKISPDGRILWETIDTIVYIDSLKYGYVGDISGVSVATDGSVFVTGSINATIAPDTAERSYGWIIKYDKNGCVIADCTKTTSTESVRLLPTVVCYPNPTTGHMYLDIKDVPSKAEMYLYDGMGRLVKTLRDLDNGLHLIELYNFSSGLYHYKVLHNGIEIGRGKVVKID